MIETILIAIILITSISAIVLSVSDSVGIDVSVKDDYHSYTMALYQIQDYYVECSGKNLINVTPIGSPIFLENVTGGFCYEKKN